MTRNTVKKRYFDWLYDLVCYDDDYTLGCSYEGLFKYLDSIEFTYILSRDGNRAEDGTDLRYRFGYEKHLDKETIERYLNNRPCSVLEMLIALSLRWEDHVMCNPDIGDRTPEWFWMMLKNLDLDEMSDDIFDEGYAENVIDRFLKREYESNGAGGLFTVDTRSEDMRNVEIWYQMCWCLGNID